MKRILIVVILLYAGWGISLGGEDFAIPDILKDNVTFWEKIYTEVSLKEGLIHDREYPLIIYEKVVIGDRGGRSRGHFIQQRKKAIEQALKNIVKKQPSQWTPREQEIVELFRKYAGPEELKTAGEQVRFQLGQRERFKEGLERSGAYLAFIQSIFKIYDIPARVAYLPHVESSFNIEAYSRVGAAGMWQFMQRTGRLFNLRIDYLVDERRDPIQSTLAAARLLKMNYEELKAWPLAITAYNHGLGSIQRAVEETDSLDIGEIIQKYTNRRFKFASKNFYGCFLAASHIAANAEKYFPDLHYHPPFQYREIRLESYLKPRTLEKQLGISQEQLKELNPALRPIVFSRQLSIPKGYRLRIPFSMSLQEAKEKLAAIPVSAKPAVPQLQHYYTVKRGDTLSLIARKMRVSVDSLIIANEISSQHHIYIGQVLRIPGVGEDTGSPVSTGTPDPAKTTPPTKPGIPSSTPTSSTPTSSTPKPSTQVSSPPKPLTGDTPGIKTPPKPGVTVKDDPAVEKPGIKTSGDIFDATIYNLEVKVLPGDRQAIVTVSAEESLGHYAEWLNTPVRKLWQSNNGKRSIRINQEVRVPLVNQRVSLEQFNTRRLEYHLAQEEDFYSQYRVVEVKERAVQYGDTLWGICTRDEEIPIWLLMKYNPGIDLGKLSVNTRLSVPVITQKEK